MRCLLILYLMFVVGPLVKGKFIRHRQRRSAFTNVVYDETWSQWSTCTSQCDGGTQERTLGCMSANNVYQPTCVTTTATCNLIPCTDDYQWTRWEECSKPCRPDQDAPTGIRKRYSSLQKGLYQSINCNAQTCQKIDGCGKADLLFVLDSSGSVGELNWYRTKQFVLDVISGLTIGPDETRVGVVIFSTDVKVEVTLGQYGRLDELRSAVWSMPYLAGSTNTADALREVRTMRSQYGRDDVKAVVVVVTDGVSNVLPETTLSEADLCRRDAMTIFAIGVSSVKDGEMQAIANQPAAFYYHYVEDYEALHSIVSTAVADTCETANQIQCADWSAWSPCSVTCGGSGVQSRSRDCGMVDYYGNVVRTFTKTENTTCQADPCIITELPAADIVFNPLPPGQNQGVDCSLCDFHDNTGYLQDPTDCGRYIECVKRPDGGYWVYNRPCPYKMFWNQDLLTCDRTPPASGCTVVPHVTTTMATTTPNQTYDCPFRRDPVEPWRFYIELNGGKLYQECLPNMQFDEDVCVCLGIPTGSPCNGELLLYFPFDTDFNDVTCNKARSDVYGSPVITPDVGRRNGNVAYFNGTSRLTVGFLYNWFAGHTVDQWTVSLWFKLGEQPTQDVGLVNNGDCRQGPSFELSIKKDLTVYGSITTDITTAAVSEQVKFNLEEWQYTAMTYDGMTISLYINGERRTESYIQHGYIANRQCPMNIAHQGVSIHSGFFHGYLDELRIYPRALKEREIQELFNKY